MNNSITAPPAGAKVSPTAPRSFRPIEACRPQDYARHRPGYPRQIIDILAAEGALPAKAVVADIGAGTGLMTRLFFPVAATIYGVEPDAGRRQWAEAQFRDQANFVSIDGAAEDTRLPAASIDLIVAAQAFHWFDRDRTYAEFKRILKPGGRVMLAWNLRDVQGDELQREYEEILKRYIPDYKHRHRQAMHPENIYAFYHHRRIKIYELHNSQEYDWHALRGRLLSTQYLPKPPHPAHDRIMEKMQQLFARRQSGGHIRFLYKTFVCLGQLR